MALPAYLGSTQSAGVQQHIAISSCLVLLIIAVVAHATTKGLSQIVTPDLQPTGDFSLSLQAKSLHIANPYKLQPESGLTEWVEFGMFKGFRLAS